MPCSGRSESGDRWKLFNLLFPPLRCLSSSLTPRKQAQTLKGASFYCLWTPYSLQVESSPFPVSANIGIGRVIPRWPACGLPLAKYRSTNGAFRIQPQTRFSSLHHQPTPAHTAPSYATNSGCPAFGHSSWELGLVLVGPVHAQPRRSLLA
jgi:hypothetical protein